MDTTSDIRHYLPPRHVHWNISVCELFGGIAQLGWFALGFGLMFVWVFTLKMDFSQPVFWGGADILPGKILKSEGTKFSIDRSAVYGFTYTFKDSKGIPQKGISYSNWQRYKPGDTCIIEVARFNNSLTRIQGTGRTPVGLFGLFPVLFLIIGLMMVLSRFRKGFRTIRLLSKGCFAYASYTHTEKASDLIKTRARSSPKATEENGRIVYRVYHTFETIDGQKYEIYTDTSYPKDLHDQKQELLVYNPNNPSDAILLDSMISKIRPAENGQLVIHGMKPLSALLFLIIPILTIAGHGWYIYHKFFI